MQPNSSRSRNERGAMAVMMALLATALFMAGAVAVDMGQVYAKRSALQSNVDMAAMAAAAKLTQATGCNAEVVTRAEEYLLKDGNEVHGQIALDLQDGSDTNGEISCPGNWRVDLTAPRARVDLGLAKIFDSGDSIDVPAAASAQIKSPKSSSLPMYAVSGCDLGPQQLSDPPPGPPPAISPPPLTPDGSAEVKNLVVTPNEAPEGSVEPFPVTVSGQVSGVPEGSTGQIVFTDSAGGSPVPAGSPAALPTGPGWNSFSVSASTVPQVVLDADGIWWVRIHVVTDASDDYSPTGEAEPFTVGDLLFCDGMVSGNFGTLKIARSDGNASTWLEQNIIQGIEPDLQLNASSAVPCSPVDSEHTPTFPSDCLGTDPGFPNEAATAGLVGTADSPGRLNTDTTPDCDRNGGSSRTGAAPALNDDVLTCFILDGHSVSDVVAGEPEILSGDIIYSPRFFMLPVIPVQASHGASGEYPVTGFRPGFITEESLTATQASPGAVNGHNGVTFHANKVESLHVVLFDEAALPLTAPARGGEIDYTGHGIKIVVLVK